MRTKLTRANLRAAVSRRFKAQIAEKVVQKFPEFQCPLEFEAYVELLEKMINLENDRLMKIAFDIFDYNQDKLICELDTYSMMQLF